MKALTIHQPWAVAIVHGSKRIENRTWRPRALQPGDRFAIHVAKTKPSAEAVVTVVRLHPDLLDLVLAPGLRGRVIGTVRYTGCIDDGDGDPWWIGPVGWTLDDPRWIPDGPAVKGRLGLWDLPNL